MYNFLHLLVVYGSFSSLGSNINNDADMALVFLQRNLQRWGSFKFMDRTVGIIFKPHFHQCLWQKTHKLTQPSWDPPLPWFKSGRKWLWWRVLLYNYKSRIVSRIICCNFNHLPTERTVPPGRPICDTMPRCFTEEQWGRWAGSVWFAVWVIILIIRSYCTFDF